MNTITLDQIDITKHTWSRLTSMLCNSGVEVVGTKPVYRPTIIKGKKTEILIFANIYNTDEVIKRLERYNGRNAEMYHVLKQIKGIKEVCY